MIITFQYAYQTALKDFPEHTETNTGIRNKLYLVAKGLN